MNILSVENISKAYNKENFVLKDVSFSLEKGKIYGLLGQNGAGKTTLIKIINDLIVPDYGNVIINGQYLNNNRKDALIHVGTIFDGGRNLYYGLTPLENAVYFGQLKGKNKNDIINRFNDFVEKIDLHKFYKRKVGTLSLGQKQRVAISVVLSYNPEILIIDEPTNGLDLFSIDSLLQLFNDIKNTREKSVLISSHDIEFISNISDEILIIHQGKLVRTIINNNKSIDFIRNTYREEISEKK